MNSERGAAGNVSADSLVVAVHDSPKKGMEIDERVFYGAKRTVSLDVSWDDDKEEPIVLVNGHRT